VVRDPGSVAGLRDTVKNIPKCSFKLHPPNRKYKQFSARGPCCWFYGGVGVPASHALPSSKEGTCVGEHFAFFCSLGGLGLGSRVPGVTATFVMPPGATRPAVPGSLFALDPSPAPRSGMVVLVACFPGRPVPKAPEKVV